MSKNSAFELDKLAKLHAFETLGENEETVKRTYKAMREFIRNEDYMKSIVISDKTIMFFLRSNKFRIEVAQRKMKK
jgi:hypothetical protein